LAKKIIFTPFPRLIAGTLATALEYIGDKPDVDGKPAGRTQGFTGEQRVFAPVKNGDHYETTRSLSQLMANTDQLFINGHCHKGLDYLSTNVECGNGKKVSVDDVILQLKAHGLLETTECKIKLWVCEGGLDDGGSKESFAKRFSRAMHAAGYTRCEIFGYVLSLLSNYRDGADGMGKRKRAVKPEDADRIAKLRKLVTEIRAQRETNKMKVRVWESAVIDAKRIRGTDELDDDVVEVAIEMILATKPSSMVMLGAFAPVVGARASTVRKRFVNGMMVG
jgi:hypothetical protein